MNELFAIVDMGTTNTRLTLADSSGSIRSSAKGNFGVKDSAATGSREILVIGLNRLTEEISQETGISLGQIKYMICSGMITSEIGLIDIPHRIAPVGVDDLAVHAQELSMPEILPSPIIFIPGIRNKSSFNQSNTHGALVLRIFGPGH